jgi:hypothetical protein
VDPVRAITQGTQAADGTVEILREVTGEGVQPELLRRFSIFAVMEHTADGWQVRVLRAFQHPVEGNRF